MPVGVLPANDPHNRRDADKTSPRAGAMFAVNMLVGTAHGSSYGEAEYTGWLRRYALS